MDTPTLAQLATVGSALGLSFHYGPGAVKWIASTARSLFASKVADTAAVQVAKEQHAAQVESADKTGQHAVATARATAEPDVIDRLFQRIEALEQRNDTLSDKIDTCERERHEDREHHRREIDEQREKHEAELNAARAESRMIVDNWSALEATFQSQVRATDEITREFAAYRARHPSDPGMLAVKP